MSVHSYNEYLYEWVCPKREDESARALLVGDFFMYEARLALERKMPFALDAVGGNTPLAGRMEHLHSLLAQREYTAVVVGESCRPGREPDTALLHDLVRAYPNIRFMAATATAPFLTKPRYQTPADALDARNAAARQTADELHLPCLDLAAVAASAGARSRCAYLTSCVAELLLPGRKLRMPRHIRKTLQSATGAFLLDEMNPGNLAPHEVLCERDSSIRWKNRYHVAGSSGLCIGDSNMYRFRLAHPFLRRHADAYSSSFSLLWEETQRDLMRSLRPEHRFVILSLGVHHAGESEAPDFAERCRALVKMLQGNGRKVVAVATTPCAREDNPAVADDVRNAALRRQNAAFRAVAEELGLPFVDAYVMLEHAEHSDPTHFHRKSYIAPARAMVRAL